MLMGVQPSAVHVFVRLPGAQKGWGRWGGGVEGEKRCNGVNGRESGGHETQRDPDVPLEDSQTLKGNGGND